MSKVVKSISLIAQQPVFDITVEDNHHYILENGLVSHNSGLKYAASTIIYLSKKKVKEGTDVIGNIIHCKLYKSRLTKENSMVDVMLNYDTGLDPYYGLVDIALKEGIFEKIGSRIQVADGTKVYEKQIYRDPQKYFTEEIMNRLEATVAKMFKYGSSFTEENNVEEESNTEEG